MSLVRRLALLHRGHGTRVLVRRRDRRITLDGLDEVAQGHERVLELMARAGDHLLGVLDDALLEHVVSAEWEMKETQPVERE